MTNGLPRNPDAERYVLGSILLASHMHGWILDRLVPKDFPIERDQQILRAMVRLRAAGDEIHTITVYAELKRAGQLATDTMTYLTSLVDGMPLNSNIESYVRLVKEQSRLREIMSQGQHLINLASSGTRSVEIVSSTFEWIERLEHAPGANDLPFSRIEDMPSIFAEETPLEYIQKPELIKGTVVVLSGNTEAGKSSLAYAWARDAWRKLGVPAVVLDRDNPRSVIQNRLKRLHWEENPPFVWGGWFNRRAPRPDDPMLLEWVKRTEVKPVFIVDNLESFIEGDENDAFFMRAFFDACRRPTYLGATVIVLHNNNREGKRRGSSVLDDAPDVGYSVTNLSSSRLLGTLRLEVWKHRDGSIENPMFGYKDGWLERLDEDRARDAGESANERLLTILRLHPNSTQTEFISRAMRSGLGRNQARDWLAGGVDSGTIQCTRGRNNSWLYSLRVSDIFDQNGGDVNKD